jgi:hypothetical protein
VAAASGFEYDVSPARRYNVMYLNFLPCSATSRADHMTIESKEGAPSLLSDNLFLFFSHTQRIRMV